MRYPGGKNGGGLYQLVINQMPPHRVYIEPFLGSGAVLYNKRPAEINIGLDIVPEVVEQYGYRLMLDQMAGERRRAKTDLATVDALAWLASYQFRGDEFVYCDPTYLMHTRRSRRPIYLHEMTIADHRRLLRILKSIPTAIAISGYRSRLYDLELRGWRRIDFRAMTRGGPSIECLWMNYPEPEALHDYRFLGANRTERQRIKRKCERWEARLEAMPLLERRALLAVIQKRYSTAASPETSTTPATQTKPTARAAPGDLVVKSVCGGHPAKTSTVARSGCARAKSPTAASDRAQVKPSATDLRADLRSRGGVF